MQKHIGNFNYKLAVYIKEAVVIMALRFMRKCAWLRGHRTARYNQSLRPKSLLCAVSLND